MPGSWGFGPVFSFECLASARRWQVYAGRVMLLLAVLGGLSLFWAPAGSTFHGFHELARLGTEVFLTVVLVQMLTVLFVAPAVTAGAICVDKSRGTLVHVFVTDIRAGEVVFGKLAARLMPILTLMLCGLPVLSLCSLLGGIDAAQVVGAYLVTAGVAILTCSLALTFSTWARRPHQALLPTYLILGLWTGLSSYLFLANGGFRGPPKTLGEYLFVLLHPICLMLSPLAFPGQFGLREQGAFLLGSILIALALAAFVSRRIRRVVLEQASRPAKRDRAGLASKVVAWLPGPPLDGNAVLWREWHRKQPTRWTGRLWTVYTVVSVVASAGVLVLYFMLPLGGVHVVAAHVNAWEIAIGLLLLSINSASSLAEERDRGSLDVIMTTPLHSKEILWGKWWGTLAMVPRLAILPIWVAAGLAMITDRWLGVASMIGLIAAYSAAIASLGLALATWIPRLARSVGCSVLVYGMLTVGFPMFLGLVNILYPQPFSSPYGDREKILLVSPFFGVLMTTEYAGRFGNFGGPQNWLDHEPVWPLLWITLYAGISLALLRATLWSFDRCLGRMPERPSWMPPAEHSRSRPPGVPTGEPARGQ